MLKGRLYIAGNVNSWEYDTRLLSMQRLLMAVNQRWPLPDLDVMIEQVPVGGWGSARSGRAPGTGQVSPGGRVHPA